MQTGPRDERGMSSSVQAALLLPLAIGLLVGLVQWALVAWAESTALAAAQQGAAVAAAEGSSEGAGEAAALEVAGNGSLSGATATVRDGGRHTTATVTGRAVVVLWPFEVSKTMVATTERVTEP